MTTPVFLHLQNRRCGLDHGQGLLGSGTLRWATDSAASPPLDRWRMREDTQQAGATVGREQEEPSKEQLREQSREEGSGVAKTHAEAEVCGGGVASPRRLPTTCTLRCQPAPSRSSQVTGEEVTVWLQLLHVSEPVHLTVDDVESLLNVITPRLHFATD